MQNNEVIVIIFYYCPNFLNIVAFTADITESVPVQSARQHKAENVDKNISENSFSLNTGIDRDGEAVFHTTKSPTDGATVEDSELEEEVCLVNVKWETFH